MVKRIIEVLLGENKYITILALVIGVLVVTFIPWPFKLAPFCGNWGYFIVVFAIVFLILCSCVFIYKILKNHNERKKERYELKQMKIQEHCALFNELWEWADALSPKDREYLKTFIETNNEPIVIPDMVESSSILLSKKYVNKTIKNFKTNERPSTSQVRKDVSIRIPINRTNERTIEIVKLNDLLYRSLKESYEKYGKISNFE